MPARKRTRLEVLIEQRETRIHAPEAVRWSQRMYQPMSEQLGLEEKAFAPLPVDPQNRAAQLAQRFQRNYDSSGGTQITSKTVELRDITGSFYRVLSINGPKDLGNGPLYSLELMDDNGQIETVWCGSEQVRTQIEGDPELITEVNSQEFVKMCVLFSFTERFSNKGEQMGYYTSRSWFGAMGDTGPALGSFS